MMVMGRKKIEVVGDVYGKLTVTGEATPHVSPSGQVHRKVYYVCSCGVRGEVQLGSIREGKTKSCGCLAVGPVNSHGKSSTKLYKVYGSMLARCNNPKAAGYAGYGGRGIKVCEEWSRSFEDFDQWATSNGYEEGLSIERKDVNGGYTPDNCTWATALQQALNKRMFKNNKSGITGVSYRAGEGRWTADWVESGKQKSKSFSMNKYGDEAKQMAIDKRLQMEKFLGITNNNDVTKDN